MIEVKNLKKSFDGNVILQNINFNVEKGDSVVIIGGSGCGKSTLLRCINRLIWPEEGEILFNGKNILDKSVDINEYRRHVGMVYQQFNLFGHLNIMENMILAPMKVLHMEKDEAISRAEKLLDKVGMLNRRYRLPAALSGGQKQRVAIARTLMMNPDAILFDEPTSALDPTMVDEVESVIRRLIDDGMTSIIVTHEMRFAEKISSKVVYLAEKSIYETGTSHQIFHEPQKELTRQFIYRSRMFEKELDPSSSDYYSVGSEIRAFLNEYAYTPRQTMGITHILEELVMPVLQNTADSRGVIRVIGSETGEAPKLMVEFTGCPCDPLKDEHVDEIGISIVRGFAAELSSAVNAAGNWEVTAQL